MENTNPAINKYTLKLSNINTASNNKSVSLTYNAGTTASKTEIKTNKGKTISLLLNEFGYSKEIYRPGRIDFTILLGWKDNTPSIDELFDTFGSCSIELYAASDEYIAQSYYIFDMRFERKSASDRQMYACFEAYSPDKYLTLDKYCKAYTGRKFISDIFKKRSLWPDATPLFSDKDSDDKLYAKLTINPRFLYKKNTQREYIQPYLVQYNESFFDFLVRVSNRCGEFLYYENDQFNLGWQAPSNVVSIDRFTSVRYNRRTSTAWEGTSLSKVHNDYTKNRNITTAEGAKMMQDSEIASDENTAYIPPKDEYTKWIDFALGKGAYALNVASTALSETTFPDVVIQAVYKASTVAINTAQLSNTANNKYLENNFTGEYLEERVCKSDGTTPAANDIANKYYDDKGVYPYSSIPDGAENRPFELSFYNDIQKGIEETERSRIHIVLENQFKYVKLGGLISIDDSGNKYIVVKIEHSVKSSDSEMLEIEAISYSDDKTVYPPAAHISHVRKANAQRAFVTHNVDPLKMGRVRVRYPWQKDTDDPTPWIRLALPMASKNSGFRFLPEIGDEAIINYENGNIERPYVEGMLFSAEKQPTFGHKDNSVRVLSSVNGHSMIFSDLDGSAFYKSFSPLLSTLNTLCPAIKIPLGADDLKKVAGGIEFTDEFGFYSLSMSSDKRAISINSPLGRVDLNAFTGITISAPNGDIKIEGKNIEIAAGNNLTLKSGRNIGAGPKSSSNWKATAGAYASKLNPIDLKFVRTVIETAIRPVAGTLRISSNRYLCLEAGGRTAKIKSSELSRSLRFKKAFNGAKDVYFSQYNLTDAFDGTIFTTRIPQLITDAKNDLIGLFNHINQAASSLCRDLTTYALHFSELMENKDQYHVEEEVEDLEDIPTAEKLYNMVKDDQRVNNFRLVDLPAPQDNAAQGVIDTYNQRQLRRRTIAGLLTILNDTKTRIAGNRNLWNIDDGKLNNFLTNTRQLNFNSTGTTFYTSDSDVFKQIKQFVSIVLPDNAVKKYTAFNSTRTQYNPEELRKCIYTILVCAVKNQRPVDNINNSLIHYDNLTISGIGKPKKYDTTNWSNFIDKITTTSKAVIVGKKFLGLDKMDKTLDQNIWDNNDKGKILFADDNNDKKTIYIDNNNSIQTYMESRNLADNTNNIIQLIQNSLRNIN